MNLNLLIDAIVRQTMVLIAQLATTAGARAPLAHVANQVFLDLVRELKEQGLGNKVIADMFGLALRGYHAKIQRLAESSTFRGQSLWQAVLDYIEASKSVRQADLLRRFARDDEATLRGVLADLVDSGLVLRTGRPPDSTYVAADLTSLGTEPDGEAVASLVWLTVHRVGPADVRTLAQLVPLESSVLARALDALVGDGRVVRSETGGAVSYSTSACVIPVGNAVGWEAAVFDHYQALVTAICTKLRLGSRRSERSDEVGGSTYGFTVWPGHPYEQDVRGHLAAQRLRLGSLREKVSAYNAAHGPPPDDAAEIVIYLGQSVLDPERGQGERGEPDRGRLYGERPNGETARTNADRGEPES